MGWRSITKLKLVITIFEYIKLVITSTPLLFFFFNLQDKLVKNAKIRGPSENGLYIYKEKRLSNDSINFLTYINN